MARTDITPTKLSSAPGDIAEPAATTIDATLVTNGVRLLSNKPRKVVVRATNTSAAGKRLPAISVLLCVLLIACQSGTSGTRAPSTPGASEATRGSPSSAVVISPAPPGSPVVRQMFKLVLPSRPDVDVVEAALPGPCGPITDSAGTKSYQVVMVAPSSGPTLRLQFGITRYSGPGAFSVMTGNPPAGSFAVGTVSEVTLGQRNIEGGGLTVDGSEKSGDFRFLLGVAPEDGLVVGNWYCA